MTAIRIRATEPETSEVDVEQDDDMVWLFDLPPDGPNITTLCWPRDQAAKIGRALMVAAGVAV